jgi:hypothetical protein
MRKKTWRERLGLEVLIAELGSDYHVKQSEAQKVGWNVVSPLGAAAACLDKLGNCPSMDLQ